MLAAEVLEHHRSIELKALIRGLLRNWCVPKRALFGRDMVDLVLGDGERHARIAPPRKKRS